MSIPSEERANKPGPCRRVRNVALGMLAVLGVALAWWHVTKPEREASRRSSCKGEMKMFGLGLHNYHDWYGSFPPAYLADKDGRPMHSWRVLLLELCGRSGVYEQYRYSEAWNSSHNRALAEELPIGMSWVVPMYHCPSDRDSDPLDTSFVVVTGPCTMYPGSGTRKIEEITDGSSNTIAIAEMAESGIHWMQPQDLDMSEMSFRVNDFESKSIRSKHAGMAHVLFADGSVRAIHEDTDPQVLRAMLTIDGGELIPPLP